MIGKNTNRFYSKSPLIYLIIAADRDKKKKIIKFTLYIHVAAHARFFFCFFINYAGYTK